MSISSLQLHQSQLLTGFRRELLSCRHRFGLTFKDYEEVPLYFKWLSLPHPELYLDYHLAEVRHIGSVQVPTPYMKAEVAAVINKEQEGRFKSIVC